VNTDAGGGSSTRRQPPAAKAKSSAAAQRINLRCESVCTLMTATVSEARPWVQGCECS
jgi:hypothetical protein